MFWITKEFTNLEPAVDICTCTILWCKYIFTLKVVINLRLTYFQNQYKLMEGYSRGSNKRKIAICSTNCVQMWKGRDQKTVFCRVRHKNHWAEDEIFVMTNPVKIVFWWKPFYMRINFWEQITFFFVETVLF